MKTKIKKGDQTYDKRTNETVRLGQEGGGMHGMNYPKKEIVEKLRVQYPVGTRIELISMDDPYSNLMPGAQGTVSVIDDTGTVFVDWDSGSKLGLVYGEDSYKAVKETTVMDTKENTGIHQTKGGALMIIVGRHINGITINPLEYILNENDELMKFATEDDAKAYLREHGISDEDMEFLVFEEFR